jgi:hypothetical protein
MWIVRLALRRPYTFIVMAMLIAIGGVIMIARTRIDIFPAINIAACDGRDSDVGWAADADWSANPTSERAHGAYAHGMALAGS